MPCYNWLYGLAIKIFSVSNKLIRMKNKISLRLPLIVCGSLLYMALPCKSMAQNWSVNFSIGTATGNYNFSYNQTPSPLVEVFSAMSPVDVGCTYQWQQSTSPVFSTY